MTENSTRELCPPESMLHDLFDGSLRIEESRVLRAHIERCDDCGRLHGRLLALRAGAHALPRELPAPDTLWSDIRSRIEAGASPARAPRDRWWSRPTALVAAALVLMFLSSAATMMLMHERAVAPVAVGGSVPSAPLHPAEAGNIAAIELLMRDLDRRRTELSPETIAAVERSLDIVDQALAEARAALARDPGNATLSELVATAYRHKLTVLRRATELAPRS